MEKVKIAVHAKATARLQKELADAKDAKEISMATLLKQVDANEKESKDENTGGDDLPRSNSDNH